MLQDYGFRFSKALGQNFLIDGNIVRKIVDAAEVTEEDIILEIGCGIGTLTEELALRAKQVFCVEIDQRLRPLLQESLPYENVEIFFGDVLKVDLAEELSRRFGEAEIKVVANLPYYVTTPIIEKLIESKLHLTSITVMVQKEVAERFSAHPNTKAYGSLSVFLQFFADVSYCFTVPRNVFMPRPNVDSAVVHLQVKENIPDIDQEQFFQIVRGGFSKRRKTLLNALSSYHFNLTKEEVEEILQRSNIAPSRRAESLSIEEFIVLSMNWKG